MRGKREEVLPAHSNIFVDERIGEEKRSEGSLSVLDQFQFGEFSQQTLGVLFVVQGNEFGVRRSFGEELLEHSMGRMFRGGTARRHSIVSERILKRIDHARWGTMFADQFEEIISFQRDALVR